MYANAFTLEFSLFICTSSNKALTPRFISNLCRLQNQARKRWPRNYRDSSTAQCSHCSPPGSKVGVFGQHPPFTLLKTNTDELGGKG